MGWGTHFQVSGLGPQVPGTGAQAQVRVQEICPLSSIVDSVILRLGWPVAAPGGRWRGLSIQPSIQPSTQSSIQFSVIDSALCPLSSTQHSVIRHHPTPAPTPAPRPGGRIWPNFEVKRGPPEEHSPWQIVERATGFPLPCPTMPHRMAFPFFTNTRNPCASCPPSC